MSRPITTASNVHRRLQCVASERLEALCPPEKESDMSLKGTLLHEAMDTGMTESEFNDYEEWCLEFCKATDDKLTKAFFGDEIPTVEREVELDLMLSDKTVRKGFGHPDNIAFVPGKALVKDWKFGFIPVEHAKSNPQLRSYAIMVSDTYFCEEVALAIVQPRAKAEDRVSIVSYTRAEIELAREELTEGLAACKDPNAPFGPSLEACRYCRAKADCPALDAEETELRKMNPNTITLGNVATWYRKAKLVKTYLGAIESTCYLLVENAVAQNLETPGITMETGDEVRKVVNPMQAMTALGLSTESFLNACKAQVTKLEVEFKAASGLKGKAVKTEFEARLKKAGCLEMRQNKPSLVLTDE